MRTQVLRDRFASVERETTLANVVQLVQELIRFRDGVSRDDRQLPAADVTGRKRQNRLPERARMERHGCAWPLREAECEFAGHHFQIRDLVQLQSPQVHGFAAFIPQPQQARPSESIPLWTTRDRFWRRRFPYTRGRHPSQTGTPSREATARQGNCSLSRSRTTSIAAEHALRPANVSTIAEYIVFSANR